MGLTSACSVNELTSRGCHSHCVEEEQEQHSPVVLYANSGTQAKNAHPTMKTDPMMTARSSALRLVRLSNGKRRNQQNCSGEGRDQKRSADRLIHLNEVEQSQI